MNQFRCVTMSEAKNRVTAELIPQQVILINIICLCSDTLNGNKQQFSLRACVPLLPVRLHVPQHAQQRQRLSRPSGFVWVLLPDQRLPANRSI